MLPRIAYSSILLILIPALQSVEIHYCFTSRTTGCDFKFGGNSSHNDIIGLNISQLNNILRIRCSFNRPVRLIPNLEKFRVWGMPPNYNTSSVVALTDLKESDSSGFIENGTNGQMLYSQWLDVHLSQTSAVEGFFQCQTYTNDRTDDHTIEQARLFVSLVKDFNPFWGTVSLVRPYRPESEDAVHQTVPCRAFGLDSSTLETLKLHKRKRSMLWIDLNPDHNGRLSIEKIHQACLQNVGETLKTLNDLGIESVADKGSYLEENWRGQDCNYDGLLTCTDAILFTFSQIFRLCETTSMGPLMRDASLSLQTALIRTILKSGATKLVNASYNPTQGFVLHEPLEYQSEYICSYEYESNDIPSAVYMPASTDINPLVQIGNDFSESDGRTFYCKFSGNASYASASFKFVLQDCNSMATCDAIFRQPMAKPDGNEKNKQIARFKIVNYNSDGTTNLEIKSPVISGMLACTGVALHAPDNHLHYFEAIDHLFTGVDGYQYFVSENSYSKSAVIQLEQATHGDLVAGESCEFKCAVSTFVLYTNVTFKLVYENNLTLELQATDQWETSFDKTLSHITTVILKLKCNERHKGLICTAPFIHKAEMVSSLLTISVLLGKDKSSLSLEATAGIAIAAVVFAVMTFALIYLVYRYKTISETVRDLTVEEVEEFRNGDKNDSLHEPDGGVNAKRLGFPADLQIAPADLSLDDNKVLGEGQYGRCVRGRIKGQDVAVKMNKSSDVSVFKDFLSELKIMAYVGTHENVVQFLGAVIDDIQKGVCYAVVELSPYGNLLELLRKSALENVGVAGYGALVSTAEEPLPVIGNVHLLRFCRQIAAGMEYLASKSIIHGDLAARNILVFEDLTAKISDFGLSRKLYGTTYLKKSKQAVPWRWMAIESLEYLQFSHKSDMWSFGVTVWEVFSFGRVPFSGLSWTTDFVNDVKAGLRPDKPSYASEDIFEFMKTCWMLEKERRPSFSDAVTFFDDQIQIQAPAEP